MNSIYRRFDLITADKEQEKAFQTLVEKKGLTREGLILILKAIKIKERS